MFITKYYQQPFLYWPLLCHTYTWKFEDIDKHV